MPIPLGVLAVAGAGAAGGGPAYERIQTVIVSTPGTIEFTNLGVAAAAYKHLQIRAVLQTNVDSNLNVNPSIRFNADSSASYFNHRLNGDGSSVTSSQTVSGGSQFDLTDASPGFGGNASIYGVLIIDILDFSNTSKNTTIRALTGSLNTGESDISLHSGLFNKTDAITSILFNNTFRANSRVSLYGIR
jgi:hypothetical protein